MPVKYTIDKSRRLVVSKTSGTVTDQDILGFLEQLQADPDFDPHFDHLYDGSKTVENKVTSELVKRRPSIKLTFAPGSWQAIVVASDHAYGMGRMYTTLHDDTGLEQRLFKTREEAMNWLVQSPNGLSHLKSDADSVG